MNQSLPPFSHFTSLLLLCIFPFMVRLQSGVVPYQFCLSLEISKLSFFSLPTTIFVHFAFFSGTPSPSPTHVFFFLSTIFSHFFSCYHTCLLPLRQLHPILPPTPGCQILVQTGSASHLSGFQHRVRQDVSPASPATCRLPGQATTHEWWHPVLGGFASTNTLL